MTRRLNIVTIGAATRDVFLQSRAIKIVRDDSYSTGEAECFALGSKIEIDHILFDIGGGGTNTAVSFARQGLRVAFLGRVGAADARGREVIAGLKKEKVDTSIVIRDARHMTGYSVILLTPRGERTVLVYRGASADYRPSDITRRTFNAEWLYVASLGGRLDTLRAIWRFAKSRDARIAWNPGLQELAHGLGKLRPFLRTADMVTVNQEEAASLVGMTRHQDIGVFQALRSVVGGITLLTQGTDGALAALGRQAWHSSTRNIPVIDTTGAGDAFASGFLGAYIRTANVPKSLQFATSNAESVIRHLGAKQGLLRRPSAIKPVAVKRI